MINVMIADDDEILSMQTASYLTNDKNIKILKRITDGSKVVPNYFKYCPDVLILDIDMPNKDGIEILNTLCNSSYEEKNKCNIIVASGKLNSFVLDYVSKVYKVFDKPYNFDNLLATVKELYLYNHQKPNYKDLCEKAALSLGFNISSIGTIMLIDAIVTLKEQNISMFNMNDLYEELGNKYNMLAQNARWNIEKSLDSMFRYGNKKDILDIFGEYDGRKPTPKYAISFALRKLRKFG